MLPSCSFVLFQTLFGETITHSGQEMWKREEDSDEARVILSSPPFTSIGDKPQFYHPSSEPDVEEEENMCLSWKQNLRLLT